MCDLRTDLISATFLYITYWDMQIFWYHNNYHDIISFLNIVYTSLYHDRNINGWCHHPSWKNLRACKKWLR